MSTLACVRVLVAEIINKDDLLISKYIANA